MLKKNGLKVGSGFLVALVLNYFFYSSGFIVQTLVCSVVVLVLYEVIDRFFIFRNRLKRWDQEYNTNFKRIKKFVDAQKKTKPNL